MSQSDPQFYEGANWMLNAVRSSIENYPDAGGDIEVYGPHRRGIQQCHR